jgi:hypothetical protein
LLDAHEQLLAARLKLIGLGPRNVAERATMLLAETLED